MSTQAPPANTGPASAPPASPSAPPVASSAPPVVSSAPPVVSSAPPVVSSPPPVVSSSPPVVGSSSSRVVSSPPVDVSSSPPVVSSSPPIVSSSPPVVSSSPPVVSSSPPVVSSPPVSVSSPPPSPSSVPVVTTSSAPPPTTSSEPPPTTSTVQNRPTSQPPQQTTTPDETSTPTPQNTSRENTTPGIVTVTANPVTLSSGAPPITSTLTSITSYESLVTEADGQVVTTTIRATVVIVPSSASSKSSSNTGAIAGGVAGGVAAIAAIIIIFLFCWRRNRRRDEFDGNFDPDRVVGHAGRTDLAGAEVTPYHYEPNAGALSGPSSPTFSGDSSMRQYRDSQALLGGSILEGAGAATATSGSHYAPTSSEGAPHGSTSHARSSSLGSAGLGPGFPVAQPYRPLSAKERDAMRQRGEGGLGLASALEEGEGDVIQHSDGGRIAEPVSPNRPVQEIPPSYDSIPATK